MRRTAARNLCNFSLRTASGPEGSSAKQSLTCAAGPPGRGGTRAGSHFSIRHSAPNFFQCPTRSSPASGGRSGSTTSSASAASRRRCATRSRAERIAQSFVFAGPRGVGKTTTARILARGAELRHGADRRSLRRRATPASRSPQGRDIDVLEIDAATNTQVDKVREVIITGLGIAPVRDRYKIFIIDEVHRLSPQSFDALLKSIEEPPPHVVFMMATTELEKVPPTIQSRSQVFELKTIGVKADRRPAPQDRRRRADRRSTTRR